MIRRAQLRSSAVTEALNSASVWDMSIAPPMVLKWSDLIQQEGQLEYGASQCDSQDQVQMQKLYHKDGKGVMFEPRTAHTDGCVLCEEKE